MNEQSTIRIDLHCHSSLSDGSATPQELAAACAAAGVRYAAITDHDTLAGLDDFESACERGGIGYLTGVELSALLDGREIHLLCYGFDRADTAFAGMIGELKRPRDPASASIYRRPAISPQALMAPVHQAGGVVLLAHPFATEPDPARLEALIASLAAAGLDGVELYHPAATPEERALLTGWAAKYGLVVSGGSDHHGIAGVGAVTPGVDMPVADWRRFREALFARRRTARSPEKATAASSAPQYDGTRTDWRRLIGWMVVPAVIALTLLLVALFGFFLPGYEKELMERKRETIKELTTTVWSMLGDAENRVRSGSITAEAARAQAAANIRSLRYGREGKDYFWLQDTAPRMIMHPYRSDLEGTDISGFTDPRGVRIFTLFADIAREKQEGYVDYVWQWKDDPARLEAKESYIKLFAPWGWIIGTGVYTNDVVQEIATIKERLIYAMAAVAALLSALLIVMIRGGLNFERQRRLAEKRLRETGERYRSLVHAAGEGVLFVRGGLCSYANPVMLELIGCGEKELPLIECRELFPALGERPAAQDPDHDRYRPLLLQRRDGIALPCLVAIRDIARSGEGSVLLVRRAEDPLPADGPQNSGVLKRLLNLPASLASDIAREIAQAEEEPTVIALCQRTPELVRALLAGGAYPPAIVRAVTAVTDAATVRFIELAQRRQGPAPVPFAFIALGSQGRGEQTLFTDQDNAIIYHDTGADDPRVAAYFQVLSGEVCGNLARSGYRPCHGRIMADNPRWCLPFGAWKEHFTRWMTRPDEREMLDLITFLDLRQVSGDGALVRELREHIFVLADATPAILTHLAQQALSFKAPLRLFGNIILPSGKKEQAGLLDLKAAMMPVVNYARLYAVKNRIAATATQERLSSLSDAGFLLPSQYHDILTVFESLLRLRLAHQSATVERGLEPDNLIDPGLLGHLDEAILRECFNEIEHFQEQIKRDFLGGVERVG